MTRTEDECLGESICPTDSPACVVQGQCLRSADNTLKYDENPFLQLPAHLKGQLISAVLWDMIKNGVPIADLSQLAFHAVTLLPSNGGYDDLFLGLFTSDETLFDGKYCQVMKDSGTSRGFDHFLEDVNCAPPDEETDPTPTIEKEQASGTQPAPTTQNSGNKKSKDVFKMCGVIDTKQQENSFLGTLLLVLPFFSFLPALLRKRALAPSTSKDR